MRITIGDAGCWNCDLAAVENTLDGKGHTICVRYLHIGDEMLLGEPIEPGPKCPGSGTYELVKVEDDV